MSDLIIFFVIVSLFLWNCLKVSLKPLGFFDRFAEYFPVSSRFGREKR